MLKHIARLRDPNGEWKAAQQLIEAFRRANIRVTVVSAEDVLDVMDRRLKTVADAAKDSAQGKKTVQSELRGARDIEEDRYWKQSDNIPPSTVKKPSVDSEVTE